jgi:hypothetical protein
MKGRSKDKTHRQERQLSVRLPPPHTQDNIKIYLKIKPQLSSSPSREILKILNAQEVEIVSPCFSSEVDKIYHY